jgi:N-acetylglucosaminyldiphosphoundecaprenol N-acetyl-beta-D-mannosaminyltransferase
MFLLGAAPGVASLAAAVLQRRHPGLVVAGTYPGAPWGGEGDASVSVVREARPDALFVAFGSPAQEMWIAEHRSELSGGVAVGVGGAFDYLAGRQKRAPAWVREAQLEWAYRLLRQPWRWRRQLALPRFARAAARPAAVEPLWV